jgi:hypothetical protein
MSTDPMDNTLDSADRPKTRILRALSITAAVTVAVSLAWVFTIGTVGQYAAWALYVALPWSLTFVQLRQSRLWVQLLLATASVLTTGIVLLILIMAATAGNIV